MSDEQKTADVASECSNTLGDFLDEKGHLPGINEADKLVEHLLKDIYDEDDKGYTYTKVALTYRPTRGSDYTQVVNRERTGGLQYGRVQPDIGIQPYWHPTDAPIPVVAFKYKDDDHTEWTTKTVHPRLVAAGREAVMERLAAYLFHEIHDTAALLSKLLQWLAVCYEEGSLETMWPVQMSLKPGKEWDVDTDDPVPSVGDEAKIKTAGQRFPHM